MDIKAVDQKRKKQKLSGQKHKGKKGDPRKTKKHGHKRQGKKGSRTRSKSKKKSGFLCCRKKNQKKRSKKSKSKTTKKQPHSKVVKPLPPVPNEKLGDVVLVKNGKVPDTPQKQESEPLTPEKENGLKPPKTNSGLNVNLSKEKIGSENIEKEEKVKVESKKGSENEKNDKIQVKSENKENEKKEQEKKKAEEKDDDSKIKASDNKMDKWKTLAKRVITEDANIAVNDFEQVSSYIPPHVTKNHFVANMPKNRFADVICLDHSRVRMSDNSYIHANWIDVDNQKKAILTQFPLRHTASNFWQMLIEQKVKCILLIMTEKELKKFGGDFVFPQNQDFLSFDDRSIRVGEFKQLELGKGWNLKVLSVTNGNYKTFIHVHHYKNWPHASIPSDVKQIWQLQSYLRKYTEPPVYMSLSGCGRAGTYALFESAHSSLHSEQPTFDMIKCLENVRNGRLHSVQNLSQFSFVYTLIAEHILGNGLCKKDVEDQENSVEGILRQLTIQ